MNDKLNFLHDKHFYFINAIQLNIKFGSFPLLLLLLFFFFFFFWWFILLVQDDNDDDNNKSSDFLSKFFKNILF